MPLLSLPLDLGFSILVSFWSFLLGSHMHHGYQPLHTSQQVYFPFITPSISFLFLPLFPPSFLQSLLFQLISHFPFASALLLCFTLFSLTPQFVICFTHMSPIFLFHLLYTFVISTIYMSLIFHRLCPPPGDHRPIHLLVFISSLSNSISLCDPSGLALWLMVCRPAGPPQLRDVVSLAGLICGAPLPVRNYKCVSLMG